MSLLVSSWLSPALAQQDPAAASALFKAGREAAKQRDYATACARFAESYRLDPAPGTGLNLADCEEKLGHLAAAWQRYKETAERLPKGDARIAPAQQRATELEPRVPHLTLRLAPSAPADTLVTRDGLELGRASLGLPLPIEPGAHRLVATAAGHKDRVFLLNFAEGQSQDLVAEPGEALVLPAPAASAPLPAPGARSPAETLSATAPPPEASLPVLGYALLGAGGLGLAVAAATGFMVASRRTTTQEHCPSGVCDPTGYQAAQSGKTLLRVNTVAWAAGLVGLGAGLYFTLRGPSAAPTASLGGAWLPGGGALSAQGAF